MAGAFRALDVGLGMRGALVCEGKTSCDVETARISIVVVWTVGVVLDSCAVNVPLHIPGRFQKEDPARNSNLRPLLEAKRRVHRRTYLVR